MISKKKSIGEQDLVYPTYGDRFFTKPIPKLDIPEEGIDPKAAYQIIHDELNLDGNPALNLASFVTTWMEDEAKQLIVENLNRNFVDRDEYPQTEVIHERVVNMLARLCNAGDEDQYVGTATIGSSEAIMLGLLAHKWKYKQRMKKMGKNHSKPNLVIGADVHVVWEKFAKYFDVELRMIPMKPDRYILDVDDVREAIDENTICVGAVLGTTFTGQIDPIEEINDMLLDVKKQKRWDIPIHVDAASGGFIVPFLYPDLKWDFRLEQVRSINISGHKYGLVYPGVGWLLFKDETDLPEDLIFYVNYLGGEEATYTLNFSRGSAMVIAQYYNLIRLGKSGYRRIMENALFNTKYLADKLKETGLFELVMDDVKLPVIAVKLKPDTGFDVYELSAKLRERGWIVPAYNLPKNADDIHVLRIVVKENFSRDMADMLLYDIKHGANELLSSSKSRVSGLIKNKKHQRIC